MRETIERTLKINIKYSLILAAILVISIIFIIKPEKAYDAVLAEKVYAETIKTKEELAIEIYGEKATLMLAIAQCESQQRQFVSSTTPLISPTNDIGFMQINVLTWDKKAKELGLDYRNSLEDNMKVGKIVLDQQGPTAWTMYRNGCYKKYMN